MLYIPLFLLFVFFKNYLSCNACILQMRNKPNQFLIQVKVSKFISFQMCDSAHLLSHYYYCYNYYFFYYLLLIYIYIYICQDIFNLFCFCFFTLFHFYYYHCYYYYCYYYYYYLFLFLTFFFFWLSNFSHLKRLRLVDYFVYLFCFLS